MKAHELKGKRFGHLVVLGKSETSRNGHTRWNVKCDCGIEKTIFATHLVSGKTTTCGSCHLKEKSRNFQGVGDMPKTYYSSLRRGAEGGKGRKPIPFDLTMENLWEVFENQKGKCALSGLPIDFRSKTASCDRIDSSLGYVKDNIQWLHKDVNMMKRHYSQGYFTNLCKMITEKTS
mgnify:CR=1 FL=1